MPQRLGQHFLTNKAATAEIIAALAIQPNDIIVEIGPGRGALTIPLLESPAKKIIAVSGKDVKKIRHAKKQPVGPVSRTADISKTKKLLGWEPKVSLEDGLSRTYHWAEKKLRAL